MNDYYVYRYIHPEYPWLYVGKTKSLESRIRTHDFGKCDNIDRKYAKLLLESSVYYLEFENSTQMSFTELYLIDKYSPYLNKKEKHNNESQMELSIPKWKKYVRNYELQEASQRYSKRLNKLNNELIISCDKIRNAEKELVFNAERLSKLADDNEFIKKYIEFSCEALEQKELINHEIGVSEIAELFDKFPDYDGMFRLDIFNCFGNSETRIIDKVGVWKVVNFDYENKELLGVWSESCVDRMNIGFAICAERFVSDVNSYSCSSLTPFILLKQINEDKIAMAEEKKAEYVSKEWFGYAELEDKKINECKEKIEHYKEVIETHLSLYQKESGIKTA